MSEVLTSILAFVVAISVLVAVHEYGHFWVARRLGVRVLRFCIGFGKPIWSRVSGRDQVEYAIAALPLGGYVKLLDEREGPVPEEQRHLAFNRQSPVRRIAILVAGPLFNFIFAVAAYWLMFVTGITALQPVIGGVEQGTAAEAAGFRAGDRIVAVDRHDTATMMDARIELLDSLVGDGEARIRVLGSDGGQRDLLLVVEGNRRTLTEGADIFPRLGILPWRPVVPPVIGSLSADGSAARSGLEVGDRIVEADGQRVTDWASWVDFVRARPEQQVAVEIERDGRRQMLDLTIGITESEQGAIGLIGAGVVVPEGLYDEVITEQRFGPLVAVGEALTRTWEMSALTVRMLYRMVTGDVSPKSISGPINIAQTAGYTASAGVAAFLAFLAIVSISLGILNLLPIPMLDGGQIVYQVAEIVKGSPVSEKAQLIGQQVGIVLLLMLMSFAFYNDIARLAG
ncbi:MAG: RIP metalloprotease RseP [Gammaproteobacteria bacterium]